MPGLGFVLDLEPAWPVACESTNGSRLTVKKRREKNRMTTPQGEASSIPCSNAKGNASPGFFRSTSSPSVDESKTPGRFRTGLSEAATRSLRSGALLAATSTSRINEATSSKRSAGDRNGQALALRSRIAASRMLGRNGQLVVVLVVQLNASNRHWALTTNSRNRIEVAGAEPNPPSNARESRLCYGAHASRLCINSGSGHPPRPSIQEINSNKEIIAFYL